jgi:hypothetical protein
MWIALRYTELNPVRAGLVVRPELWPWSTAGVHCGAEVSDSWLDLATWSERWTAARNLENVSSVPRFPLSPATGFGASLSFLNTNTAVSSF